MKITTALRPWMRILICTGFFALWLPVGAAEYSFDPLNEPFNVHRPSNLLPSGVRRVAVLPLASTSTRDLVEGCEALNPILLEELTKSKRFEVVGVEPQSLKRATSQPAWKGEEILPADLLSWLSNRFGCDAVLIPQLTVFRGYPPLAVGLRLKLVDIRSGQILWATDEVFDAGQASVIAAAKRFERDENGARTSNDDWALLHSPRRFGRYSAATLVGLLPRR